MKALCAVLAAWVLMCGPCPEGRAEGEALRPALIRSAEVYDPDGETGGWVLRTTTEYEYENGCPLSVTVYDHNTGERTVTAFEYVFEDGLPVSMTRYNGQGFAEETAEYACGRLMRILRNEQDGNSTTETLFSYTDKGDYFTLLLSRERFLDPTGESTGYTKEEVDSVSVTLRNGLLARTVNTGLYANWNDGEEKEWERFNGTYAADYDEDGIISSTSAVFRAGPEGAADLFEITKMDGRITEVIHALRYPGEDAAQPMERIVFTYGETETDPARYALMINAHIVTDGYSYRYYWY